MQLTPIQTIIIIAAVALGTMITRFTPFLLFPEHKEPPKVIADLGKILPSAMMGLLVVYCLKGIDIRMGSRGIPEAIAILCIIVLHKWKGNVLISIIGGTAVYMALLQLVF